MAVYLAGAQAKGRGVKAALLIATATIGSLLAFGIVYLFARRKIDETIAEVKRDPLSFLSS